MKFLRIVFALALCFCLSKAEAQPSEAAQSTIEQNQVYVGTPEDAVKWLVYAFNRNNEFAGRANRVVGANSKDPALLEVEKEYQKARGTFLLSVGDFKTAVTGNQATVNFQATLTDHLLNQVSQSETMKMQQFQSEYEIFWKAMPGNPEDLVNGKENGILLRLATFMAYPQEMLDLSHSIVSQQNMGKLLHGLSQLSQDYDEKYAIKTDDFVKMLAPYVQSEQLFHAPADKFGDVSYSINSKIAGLNIHKVSYDTVLVYEGKEGNLAFRYGGKSIVGLKNGTIKMVTPEQAKNLRWEP